MRLMLKCTVTGALVLILGLVGLIGGPGSTAQQASMKNPPTGFRGVPWHAHRKDIDGLMFKKHDVDNVPEVDVYVRKGEALTLGNAVLSKVEYCFYEGSFIGVKIYAHGKSNYEKLKDYCCSEQGPGECQMRGSGPKLLLGRIPVPYQVCRWGWPDGYMSLEFYDSTDTALLDFGTA